jgi:hypothetical protein
MVPAFDYGVKRPSRHLPTFLIKYCRRDLWDVVDSFWVNVRAGKGSDSGRVEPRRLPSPQG